MNSVILIGRLTRDPELRYIPNTGTPVATFSLAVDKQLSREKKQEMEAKGQPTADFINIVVWGKQAEHCANYLTKGRLAAIQGRLQSRSYDAKDGSRRYVTEVVADRVQFLEWGNDNNTGFDSGDLDFSGIDGFEPVDDDNIPF
ncbi:single-stranded DNA-binding protein [Tepidimicrobium xylanilyticum]|uniref:Single-stranded DNA-binding protein n=1 Tax=Tepidimicrobium xylanilyticum TaxID=1123352 RepID=A0A1H3CDK6_9FIRM|nr:single-stranded DNA-binding protein [Tepidimicrobium xylanilyticum]GMG98021.1 single-stranded DNA-binding protein 3 [Tepidimicrobium xylanilyticum]SDX51998.1 single-strand binding protein [Tepidimicrobium xylanilyticum]